MKLKNLLIALLFGLSAFAVKLCVANPTHAGPKNETIISHDEIQLQLNDATPLHFEYSPAIHCEILYFKAVYFGQRIVSKIDGGRKASYKYLMNSPRDYAIAYGLRN